ncbi:MAG: hypothetical protein OEM94_05875, partial [Acidimicrobiia bacterium]|nr:hypothetical protein [Acidimicrobiia bacterium]
FFVVGLIVADGDGIPVWVALPPVLAVGAIILFSVRYWRRRPIMPDHFADYAKTARFRAGLSLLPAAAGLLMTVLSGEWWIAAVGAVIGFASLAVAPTSDADYQRHVDLFVAVGEMPPEEKWGEAAPDEVTPWDDEHGGHGHGMSHSH